jgi:hypothetical protein
MEKYSPGLAVRLCQSAMAFNRCINAMSAKSEPVVMRYAFTMILLCGDGCFCKRYYAAFCLTEWGVQPPGMGCTRGLTFHLTRLAFVTDIEAPTADIWLWFIEAVSTLGNRATL